MFGNSMMMGGAVEPQGQQVFTALGSVNWVVPSGVTSISAVAVGCGRHGGGALSYSNNIPVSSGETLIIVLTNTEGGFSSILRGSTVLLSAQNGFWKFSAFPNARRGGISSNGIGQVRFDGGGAGFDATDSNGNRAEGGAGGAAGYHSSGGSGTNGQAFSGDDGSSGGGGGGVGLLGGVTQISPRGGWGGQNPGINGGGGVGSYGGQNGAVFMVGGLYGGGGNGAVGTSLGAIRMMWGGGRSYPANAGNL